MKDYYFAAASHIGPFVRVINGIRLDMKESTPYINSGVMLMNLSLLKKEQNFDEVFSFIDRKKSSLVLPDQDIISAIYGTKIISLDTFRYNMTENLFMLHSPFERALTLDWIRKNTTVIHYCGRNKPWKENYKGYLNIFYNEMVDDMKNKGFAIN
jgi:lipopolysaccharide biosynthesis glycosyltransferase